MVTKISSDDAPGDDLAGLTFSPASGAAASTVGTTPDDAQPTQDQSMAAVEAVMAKLILAGLKTLRSILARKLPELRETWPDEVLQAPAEAAIPLINRHLSALMELAKASPEIAGLVIACLPLGMGYIEAVDKHQRTFETVDPVPSE